MPTYGYTCPACASDFARTDSMAEYQSVRPCPRCDTACERSMGDLTSVGLILPDTPLPIKTPGYNVGQKGGKSAAQQERDYKEMIGQYRADSRRAKLERGTSRRPDDTHMEMKGKIPRELYISRTRDYGKDYWTDEGSKALKRDGLLFDQ